MQANTSRAGEPAPLAYSVKEAARVSSISKSGIHNLISAGKLKAKRIGRRTIIPADSLRALIEDEAA